MKLKLKSGEKLTVLVVDDENDIRETLVTFLEMMEVFSFVIQAANGSEASMKLKNQEVDLLITDLMMPKIKGIDLVQILKEQDERKKTNTPVMILSGNITGEEVQKAIHFGVKYVMTKPCTAEQFIKKVEEIIVKDLRSKVKVLKDEEQAS
jgi:two-component system response regulator YesN